MKASIRRQRLWQIVATGAIAAGFAAPLVQATPAEARCDPDQPRRIFTISKVRGSRLLTNVRSAWADQGITIGYQESKTATVSASVSGQIGGEVGAVIASANVQLGADVGVSWSKSSTWSYSGTVPRGREGRIVMYRESRIFAVTKKSMGPHCNYIVRYRNVPINAPLIAGYSYIFVMQTRPRGRHGLRLDNDYFTDEIVLPSPPPRPGVNGRPG
jgi:hypothetical protein